MRSACIFCAHVENSYKSAFPAGNISSDQFINIFVIESALYKLKKGIHIYIINICVLLMSTQKMSTIRG